MPFFLSILVQIACAVHCARNNRNGLWLMVIIFLWLPGCLAYAIFEQVVAMVRHDGTQDGTCPLRASTSPAR